MARSAKKKGPVSALAATRANLSKIFKDSTEYHTELDMNRLKESLPHIPTGSLAMDWLIGGQPNTFGVPPCPGIPRGKIIQLWGHEAAGKTTFALTVAASTCAGGGSVLYLDWEHAVDVGYASILGVPVTDPDKFMLSQPNTMEDGLRIMWVAVSSGVDLVVVDSVGAAVPEAEAQKSTKEVADTGQVGRVARVWSSYLRKLQARITRTGTAVIGISQVRSKISTGGKSYGPQETIQGGNAWKFWASVRISLRKVQKKTAKVYSTFRHKVDEVVIGNRVKAKLVKCKVSPNQGHEIEFVIRQGYGIDDVATAMEIATAHGIIKKSSSWLTWNRPNEDPLKFQGEEKMRKEILERNLMAELYGQVRPFLSQEAPEGEEEEEFVDPVVDELDALLGDV